MWPAGWPASDVFGLPHPFWVILLGDIFLITCCIFFYLLTDSEWEERQKTRQLEMEACSKALAVLSGDDALEVKIMEAEKQFPIRAFNLFFAILIFF